ncbi:MAG: EAL domain-containing protein [Pseudomonadota bacterium]
MSREALALLEKGQPPATGPLAAIRVLIADDDPVMRAMLRAAVRKLGFEPVLAEDGAAALLAFREAPCSLVLLDVEMPGLNGYELCGVLRHEAGPFVPIVLVTGNDDVASVENAYAAGATDFISKPVNWPILGHRLRHLLKNFGIQRDLQRAQARNAAILDALPDLLFELDAQGRFIQCNAPASEALATHHRALTGRTVSEALSPKLRELAMAAIAEARTLGHASPRTYRLHLPVGERWFELSVARKAADGTRDGQGGQEGPTFIALSRDVTARKDAERRISDLADSLRHANAELRRANDQLQRQAFEDPLTGLPNRAMFHERLDQALQRIAAQGMPTGGGLPCELGVMFIDLDGFKPINDTFGHAAGDGVLKEVARRLQSVVRGADLLARLGGDEFVALIESPTAGEDAMRVGGRIIEVLRRPYSVGRHRVSLSCSIGVVLHPVQEPSGDRLLACADAAMYEAKRAGGSCCVLYERSMSDEGTEAVLMRQALRESLERGDLVLHYQPKVDCTQGQVHGLEALLRWEHEKFGQVSPEIFIPLAERYGLIGAIGNWVIDTASAQLAQWQAQGLRCHIAINLSPHQLRQPDLVERIGQALAAHRLRPSQLVCEITESTMMEHSVQERATLERIAALGVRLSIDDFGTGYSSLAHLRHIPARQLKIDRSFVTDLASSEQARHVVQAVIQLAHGLGMEVVAEGVETEAQMQVLSRQGCDLVQGFHIAPPMPAADVPGWMRNREHTPSLWGPLPKPAG